ncbi:outer membrane protein [Bartonella quintana]|uniref:Hemin binding protein a n=4 Tax=Bartonella quintana TaxID=803 RepID=A0A0H3LTG0_BARQU|nr:outer membrane protein [Bartonella quintana]AAF78059.1 hemin-binding surface protein A precursor [Bartonella quintana]AAM68129.1 hemin-binding protein A [Bartonella quintana]ETS13431.1 hypothetical protein Q651_00388 [Bartonella quintana BQ2-D70]ETS13910.1 hypothetical protein Q650_00526 [Bartonella quintana JK 73rel]ETS15597.1 hypothetical protein Q649_00535 [Bartonella quintana JK 73]
MNIKSLITTSVIALVSASAAQAADVIATHEAAPVITTPNFSWTGFYIGGQIGNFTSDNKIKGLGKETSIFTKELTPQLSGIVGGIYAGSNIDLGSGLILGVETDAIWADCEATKTSAIRTLSVPQANSLNDEFKAAGITLKDKFSENDTMSDHYTYKAKWSGATRARIGFSAFDRVMPYFAGGVAYARMQGMKSVSGMNAAKNKKLGGGLYDETKMMVGFTVSGGVDVAMTGNVLLRGEYRYSDFGKKKFLNNTQEFNYKTNDFRFGVAYKF